MKLALFDAAWHPGERYKVYGGTARMDCRIYCRDDDSDPVGRPTNIVGPYAVLDDIAREMNDARRKT